MTWHDHAVCRGMDTEVFYPVSRDATALAREVRRAKAICAGCPVRSECLSDALDRHDVHGIWGGLGEDERRVLMQSRPGTRTGAMDAVVSSRRVRVAELQGRGLTTRQIAAECGVSHETIRSDVRALAAGAVAG